MDIHTDLVCSLTGYDVIIYFWSEAKAEKTDCRKYRYDATTRRLHLPHKAVGYDITLALPVSCKMQLNTAQKCAKRVGPAKESNNSINI